MTSKRERVISFATWFTYLKKADITWTFVIILSRGVDEENSFLQQNVEKKTSLTSSERSWKNRFNYPSIINSCAWWKKNHEKMKQENEWENIGSVLFCFGLK